MYNIYCLQGFNNYYNRVVKKFNNIQDYINHQKNISKQQQSFSGINFNPNDCVNTTQILNWPNKWLPDYFIVEDADTGEFSRWFVMEAERQRGQQYLFTLRRDLLVDYYNTTINSPCFIEKATLNYSDPFIYNNEGMSFNQIKTSELLLKDKSNSAWIVGYYDYNYKEAGGSTVHQLQAEFSEDLPFQAEVSSSIENWKFYKYISQYANILTQVAYVQMWQNYNDFYACFATGEYEGTEVIGFADSALNFKSNLESFLGVSLSENSVWWSGENTRIAPDDFQIYPIQNAYEKYGFNNLKNILQNYFPFISNTEYDELMSFNNKVVKFVDSGGNVKYYKISIKNILDTVNSTFTSGNVAYKSIQATGSLYTELNKIQKYTRETDTLGFYYYENYMNSDKYWTRVGYKSLQMSVEELTYGKYSTQFPTAVYKLTDAPYGMFCIPYPSAGDDVIIKNTGGSNPNGIRIDRDISLKIAQALGTKYSGAGAIYDLQLLPYCPVNQIITSNGLDLKNDTKVFTPIIRTEGTTQTTVSYILFASFSSFTIDIPLENPVYIENKKIQSQTDFYRLVSPNYNGQFEFNAAKNNGISNINVDCTYKPYNPYIHLNPNFSELYGSDFNDSRGLICGGDFSMTLMNNAWQTYQIQNKNYQNIFDREVQNLEVDNSVARQRDVYKGITKTLTGGMTGAIAGAKGGVAGAIAGGIAGTATGAIGGALNYQWNEILRDEAIDYKIDQFGYKLGNIQALPQSISKTTAFTYNNKIFPILEYYTCTEEEKIALANKIAYNGMTTMRIGKISDFINNEWSYKTITSKNYIKGQVIRIEDINCDDFHVANEIANEVFKGAFYETKI